MFTKNFRVTKSNWFTIAKAVSTVAVLAIIVPIFSQQVQADAVCTEQLRQEIQQQIDTFDVLEKAPTPQERGAESKKEFEQIKSKQTSKNLEKLKSDLIKSTKSKFSSIDPIVTEDYAVIFSEYDLNPKSFKATVVINSNYNDGQVLNSDIIYDIKQTSLNKFEITEIKDIIGQTQLPEDLEYLNKLEQQNSVNGKIVKDNPLGMSDVEWSNLKKQKQENEKNIPTPTYREQYNEYMRDKRPEFRKKKSELLKQKEIATCNGIKVKAGLASGANYNRDAAANYAYF